MVAHIENAILNSHRLLGISDTLNLFKGLFLKVNLYNRSVSPAFINGGIGGFFFSNKAIDTGAKFFTRDNQFGLLGLKIHLFNTTIIVGLTIIFTQRGYIKVAIIQSHCSRIIRHKLNCILKFAGFSIVDCHEASRIGEIVFSISTITYE